MRITFWWPNCDFLNGEWNYEKQIDSYVVEATPEEAARSILIYPNTEKTGALSALGLEHYLVSKDLSSIFQIAWFYPISNQWNGWSPFRPLAKAVEISDLRCLASGDDPKDFRDRACQPQKA